jgi:hypothetical protein
MFALSTRFGALADRHGPRLYMGVGPLVAAVGIVLLLMRVDADASYVADVLPGLLVFGLGLSMTVAPLTMTVLADADEHNAGIASGVNNAIARVAGLVAIAAVGAVVAASFASKLEDEVGAAALRRPEVAKAVQEAERQPLSTVSVQGVPEDVQASVRESAADASVSAFHVGLGIAATLVGLGGLLGLLAITNVRRTVAAADCPGGQLVGHPEDATRQSPCDWGDQARPIAAALTAEDAESSGTAR